MTILDQITRETQALPPKKRQEVLKFVRTIRSRSIASTNSTRKTLGKARKELRAVKGMWKNRKDLPADSVEASIELRRRLMRRANNG